MAAVATRNGWPGQRARQFVRHLLEMIAAMVLGMVVLGAAFREIHVLVFGTGFDEAWHEHVALAVLAMTFNMTAPMVAWMRHRGHSWQRCGEMAAAMVVPAVALLLLDALGAISAHVVLPLQMALMLPCMVAAMLYRLDDYAAPHVRRPEAGRTRA